MPFELLHEPTRYQTFDLELTLQCGQGHRWREVDEYLKWASSEEKRLRRSSDGEELLGWFSTEEEYLTWSSNERKHRGWYSSIIDGVPVWIRQAGGPREQVEFETTANASAMRDKLRSQFRLDDDIERIYDDLGSRNNIMAQLVDHHHGLRVMRVDLWECLVFFILAARTPVPKTQQRLDDIARAFSTGPSLANGRHPFPSPGQIGSDSGLRKLNHLNLGLSAKRDYIYEAARRQEPNPTGRPYIGRSLDQIANASRRNPLSDAISELRKIPGVGAKTANCVALFGLGYLDAFPLDTHILATLKSLYLDQPYAGYASQFLFIEGLTHALSDERRKAFEE